MLLALGLAGGRARAACDLIPASARSFPSSLGDVSTPLAQPGQEVTVRRTSPVFSPDPVRNAVRLEFHPGGGPVTIRTVSALPPLDGSGCPTAQCTAGACRCIRFLFPDTDADVGTPDDKHGLTGPVRIVVQTDFGNGPVETARIDELHLPDTPFRDDLFPSFVALPRANPFVDLRQGPGGALLAAADDAGNLFIPFNFADLTPPPNVMDVSVQTHFVDVTAPNSVSLASFDIAAFTRDGRRLPPLLRVLSAKEALGTVDAPGSVLRIANVPPGPLLTQEDGIGPIIVPGITGLSDPGKRGDGLTLRATHHWAVYENRECGLQDLQSDCIDINGDGDMTDYFLMALDLDTEGATPIIIDQVDASQFQGYPNGFAPAPLYRFLSTDDLVAFEISEATIADINGDGDKVDIIRSGAFDLRNRVPIPFAAGSSRLAIDGSLVAFTVPAASDPSKDVLYYYDAADPSPEARLVQDAADPEFFVLPLNPDIARVTISALSPNNTYRLDVGGGRIAFIVDEGVQGRDLDGSGSPGIVLMVRQPDGQITPARDISPTLGDVRMTSRWIEYMRVGLDLSGQIAFSDVVVLDAAQPTRQVAVLCHDDGFFGTPIGRPSDEIVPCALSEAGFFGGVPVDRNGDKDFLDFVLHLGVGSPTDAGLSERDLALAANALGFGGLPAGFGVLYSPVVSGPLMAIGIDETAQGVDLDGDNVIGATSGFGLPVSVLHFFDARTNRLLDLRNDLGAPTEPLLHFFEDGLSFVTPDLRRTFLRDFDHDGYFEEPYFDPTTNTTRLLDNCPTVYNPDQADSNGDGIGDACQTLICGSAPDVACNHPSPGAHGSVELVRGASRAQDRFRWTWWSRVPFDAATVGDPASDDGTGYQLCFYENGTPILGLSIPAGGACGRDRCWTRGSRRLRFRSMNSGIQRIELARRAAGRSEIMVKGRGAGLGLPVLPLARPPLVVQLTDTRGGCWAEQFDYPPAGANNSRVFIDKGE